MGRVIKINSITKQSVRLFSQCCLAILAFSFHICANAAISWPQEVIADEGKIIVYQPQPEKLQGNQLFGRSAMSLEIEDQAEPIFGAFWFKATIDTDQDNGIAIIHSVEVTRVRWPDSKDAGEQRFTQIIENAIPRSGFEISLERLSASLASAELEVKSLADLKNDPPVIIFKDKLAVLLFYDGKPRFSKIEKSHYERAVNTPFLVVRDINSSQVYLSSGTTWYTASDALGPWQFIQSVPTELVEALPKSADGSSLSKQSSANNALEIVVATEPTELIVSDGKAKWESLPGGELLYVQNTETPWLRDLAGGNQYVLLAGRWFRAKSSSGPWTFVRADELPASFAEIPPASDIGGIRTSVAGTAEAEAAILDAQIPQTAAIKRSEAKLTVDYDGKPQFEKIPGTDVAYAINTGSQVLFIFKKYYAVDNGVWFVSSSATGPWQVADEIPEEAIAEIPPSSPVYNTRYVYIYDSTPEVVYVGYTPGYLWSFPYYGVPVYGSGWYYPPYIGPIYYPRPGTWGLHVGYNPWTGWNYGLTWSNGFLTVGFTFGHGHHHHGHGWYGGGYHGPIIINDRDFNIGEINIGNNISAGNRDKIAGKLENRPNDQLGQLSKDNLYKRAENISRTVDREVLQQGFQNSATVKNRANDLFADQDGSIFRRKDDTWQTREKSSWKNSDTYGTQVFKSKRDNLNRSFNARQIGTSRERLKGSFGNRRR